MIKLNEMLFKQRIEISPQIVCGINNVIILHITMLVLLRRSKV